MGRVGVGREETPDLQCSLVWGGYFSVDIDMVAGPCWSIMRHVRLMISKAL